MTPVDSGGFMHNGFAFVLLCSGMLLVGCSGGGPGDRADGGPGGVDGGAPADGGGLDVGPVAAADVTVTIDPSAASAWTVDRRIFGRFMEHNGRDAYPGLYAQHLANGSFEDWFDEGEGDRTELAYGEVASHPDMPLPWEPRVVPASGAGTPPTFQRVAGGTNGQSYQRIVNATASRTGAVVQRTALPDQRTLGYVVKLDVRGTAGPLRVALEDPSGEVLAEASVPVASNWVWHEVPLTLARTSGSRYQSLPPFGEYTLVLVAEGAGQVDLDSVRVMSGDAAAGMFNPTTLTLLREHGVTGMRWPGGNWASAYRWRDGIGPLHMRPTRPNVAWGGLEPNLLGTHEFLELCRLAQLEPLINVGFSEEITPEEAAQWVQYVNGAATTPMGQLRADNGRTEPWNVELWQVGNEVYGPYQVGHTTAEDFAERYKAYYDAMKAVDPTITVIAAGIDPLYVDFGGNTWNETLFDVARERVEVLDIHRYVRGIVDDGLRNGWEAEEYIQRLVAFPTTYEQILRDLRASAASYGLEELDISVGEWNLQAQVSEGWPLPDYPTMAHASFVAGMYNTFIRQGDAVRFAYQRDNTLYFRAYPIDTRPVNPGAHTLALYSEPFDEGEHHQLPLVLEGPTFFAPRTGLRIPASEDVPFVDGAALLSADGSVATVFVTNRHLSNTYDVRFQLAGELRPATRVEVVRQLGHDPFARQSSWDGPETFRLELLELAPHSSDGSVSLALPPASVARLRFRLP